MFATRSVRTRSLPGASQRKLTTLASAPNTQNCQHSARSSERKQDKFWVPEHRALGFPLLTLFYDEDTAMARDNTPRATGERAPDRRSSDSRPSTWCTE